MKSSAFVHRRFVIRREAEKKPVVFVIDRDLAGAGGLAIEFGGFRLVGVREAVGIRHDSLRVRLAPASWNMIRLALAG